MQAIKGRLILTLRRVGKGIQVTSSYCSEDGVPLLDFGTWQVPDGGCVDVCPVYALPEQAKFLDAQYHFAFDPETLEVNYREREGS